MSIIRIDLLEQKFYIGIKEFQTGLRRKEFATEKDSREILGNVSDDDLMEVYALLLSLARKHEQVLLRQGLSRT